jgi:DNA polymerase
VPTYAIAKQRHNTPADHDLFSEPASASFRVSATILHRDYETRSTLDLKKVGAWKYATDPTTDVWCCAHAVDDGPVSIWVPGDPVPPEFIQASSNPEWVVSAFNDNFERLIEQHIMAPRYDWPFIPIERHRCTQAAALSLGLPAGLDKVAEALSLEQRKDEAGRLLMLRMARPREPRPGEDPSQIYWHDDPENIERLGGYCKQDNLTERAAFRRVGHLSAAEQTIWQLDMVINDRGVHVDVKLIEAAIRIGTDAKEENDAELRTITGGAVETAGQVDRLLGWLAANGCELPDLKKTTLKRALKRVEPSKAVRRAIKLRLRGAHAATAKYETLRDWTSADGRIRGALTYHGAATGRWTSFGAQLQNLKRPTIPDLVSAIEAVSTGSYAYLRTKYEDALSVVGDVVRAAICAAPGHRLIAADFSGVESRVTAWLAGEQAKLDMWVKYDETQNSTDEPYYHLGCRLGFPAEVARASGKVADLAFGFVGGEGAYRKLAPEGDASTKDDINRQRRAWRDAHSAVVKLWDALSVQAVRAVANPDKVCRVNDKLSFKYDGIFLRMHLPSGRAIAYPFPRLQEGKYAKAVVFKDNSGGKFVDCRNGDGAWAATWIENAVQRWRVTCLPPRCSGLRPPFILSCFMSTMRSLQRSPTASAVKRNSFKY